jgi:arylsulfatase
MVGEHSAERKEPLFWQWQHGKAVRDGDWKLVAYKGGWELYNLKNDPVEEEDLILQEPDKAEELKKYYAEWAKQYETD